MALTQHRPHPRTSAVRGYHNESCNRWAGGGVRLTALTGAASADQGHAFTFRFSGPFAQVGASTFSGNTETLTTANVSSNPFTGETTLNLEEGTFTFDANHNITGLVDTSAFATSGFSFDKTGFAGATLTASIPASACSYDAFDNLIGCSPTTLSASVTWTGQGPVHVGVQNDHFNGFGFNEVDHFDGAVRIATATGTVGDITLTGSEVAGVQVQSSDLGTLTEGTTAVCIGNSC